MNKAGFLSSNRVLLSLVLKRYHEPLRLPIQPAVISFPYTERFMPLKHYCIGSPALVCLSSTACRPCYPGRYYRLLPLPESAIFGLPHVSTGSASSICIDEATCRFACAAACGFANWELTTPDCSDAAPLNYRGERIIPRTGL